MSRFIMSSAVCASMLLAGCSEKGGGNDEPKTYTITVTSGGNGTASADKAAAEAGTTVTLTTTPDTGYSFDKWTVESGGALLPPQANVFTMPADNVRIKAEFAEIPTYAVSVTSGGNGTAVADMTAAAEGATVKLTATPISGYGFDKWTVESGNVELSSPTAATTTFTMTAGNVSVKAEFVEGTRINGIVWAFCNVNHPGTFAANPEDAGMFYQWNRKVGWSASELVNSDGGTTWDTTDATGFSWAADNDPCPAGWRVPTQEEYIALCDTEKTTIGEWTELNGVNGRTFTDKAFGNSIFLPAAGYRADFSGNYMSVGSLGFYWSGTPSSAVIAVNARALYFASDKVSSYYTRERSYGFSVRCVAE